jgi:hypothetical protein
MCNFNDLEKYVISEKQPHNHKHIKHNEAKLLSPIKKEARRICAEHKSSTIYSYAQQTEHKTN